MSDKPFQKLNVLEQLLRKVHPAGMLDDRFVQCTIELICGFELFNTRPYHNYETWSNGWRISNHDKTVVVEKEDLDDAVYEYVKKIKERKEND